MNVVSYDYQVLRYRPDMVNGEFVNVGVVMYVKEERSLIVKVIDKYQRISQFFDDVNGTFLINTLKRIAQGIDQKAKWLEDTLSFAPFPSLDQITASVIQTDDSALFFTPLQSGIHLSVQKAMDDLIELFLPHTVADEHRLTDQEVWTQVYKRFFDEKGLSKVFTKKTVDAGGENIEFDLAYKNGIWNCIEPASFQLKQESSVKDKVNKIIGKLDALSESKEELKYHLLIYHKDLSTDLQHYISKRLNKKKLGSACINLVTPERVQQFIKQVEHDLATH